MRESPAAGAVLPRGASITQQELVATRELFWNNVVREMLTALSIQWAQRSAAQEQTEPDVFDGRIAVITMLGQRIPIAAVYPVFACGVPGTQAERVLSQAVESTVFQIETPGGEAFTIPIHEVRLLHTVSGELMEQVMRASASQEQDEKGSDVPFGFAAFTSLARSRNALDGFQPPSITGPGLG